eukprot:ctg_348.g260
MKNRSDWLAVSAAVSPARRCCRARAPPIGRALLLLRLCRVWSSEAAIQHQAVRTLPEGALRESDRASGAGVQGSLVGVELGVEAANSWSHRLAIVSDLQAQNAAFRVVAALSGSSTVVSALRNPIFMASAPRRSALYCGTVTHSRRQPNAYQFTYSVFLVYVDLLELAHHRWRFPPWPLLGSHAWVPAVAWLQKRHHLKGFQGGSRRRDPVRGRRRTEPERLDDAVRQLVQRELHLAEPPRGPIRLLTNLTYWGIEFNPVSFYYVFDEADQRVEYVVAEINNIPWFEQHAYVLRPCQDGEPATRRGAATGVGRSSGGASGVTAGSVVDDGTDDVVAEASPPPPSAAVTRSSSTCWLTRRALGGSAAAGLNGSNNNNHLGGRWDDSNAFFTVFEEHPKAFHVSPFIPMDRVHYKWLFSRPGVATVRWGIALPTPPQSLHRDPAAGTAPTHAQRARHLASLRCPVGTARSAGRQACAWRTPPRSNLNSTQTCVRTAPKNPIAAPARCCTAGGAATRPAWARNARRCPRCAPSTDRAPRPHRRCSARATTGSNYRGICAC